eukprot:1018860-Pleurochrysis_carterae.AAC.1
MLRSPLRSPPQHSLHLWRGKRLLLGIAALAGSRCAGRRSRPLRQVRSLQAPRLGRLRCKLHTHLLHPARAHWKRLPRHQGRVLERH